LVWASDGKQTRATPIQMLYEQGRVHHVGNVPLLEDEMCTWIPGQGRSPNRVDALVWGITELRLQSGSFFK
jgi:phage terminase large subunit-like protein